MGVVKAPVCNLPLLYTPCPCAVPIIPLPSLTPSSFAFRHVAAWFHIRTEKLCYQSQLFTLHRVSRIVYTKRPFSLSKTCVEIPLFLFAEKLLKKGKKCLFHNRVGIVTRSLDDLSQ